MDTRRVALERANSIFCLLYPIVSFFVSKNSGAGGASPVECLGTNILVFTMESGPTSPVRNFTPMGISLWGVVGSGRRGYRWTGLITLNKIEGLEKYFEQGVVVLRRKAWFSHIKNNFRCQAN